MQLPSIEIIFNLHPPICEVCAIKLFYSRRLSCFFYHCFHSNLTLGSNTSCRELTRNSQPVRNKKNRENTHQFSYVHGVVGISLLLEKKYKVRLKKSPIKNHAILFGSVESSTGSNTTRLHKAQQGK